MAVAQHDKWRFFSPAPGLSRARYRESKKYHVIGSLVVLLLLLVTLERRVFTLPVRLADLPEKHEHKHDKKRHEKQQTENCPRLKSHLNGQWKHRLFENASSWKGFFGSSNSSPSSSGGPSLPSYLPKEVRWLSGEEEMPLYYERCRTEQYRGFIYCASLGNQCGACGTRAFRPSHSAWIHYPDPDNHNQNHQNNHQNNDNNEYDSPSLRLIQRLARSNQTLCFAGDSIDKQFFFALINNLHRAKLFSKNASDMTLITRTTDINFTNETGKPVAPGYQVMTNIIETVVSWKRTNRTAVFRYFKMYGWSPWNLAFMEQCNLLILNLGLHYHSNLPMTGIHCPKQPLVDDVQAAITYLVDFATSKPNRLAIWRSALPQHFDSVDGHYARGITNSSCVPIPTNAITNNTIQNYNKAYDKAFDKLCHDNDDDPCKGLTIQKTCTVDQRNQSYQSFYKYAMENNYTKLLEPFLLRHKINSSIVTGNILRWDIANLFDVSQWHVGDTDCSHFCYVPTMYEASFERLNLMLELSNW